MMDPSPTQRTFVRAVLVAAALPLLGFAGCSAEDEEFPLGDGSDSTQGDVDEATTGDIESDDEESSDAGGVDPDGSDELLNPRDPVAVAGYCHFFQHPGYGGKRFDVKTGDSYNTLHNPSLNWSTGSGRPGDRFSSVSCGPGTYMLITEHSQWGGSAYYVGTNNSAVPNLHAFGFGDNVSAILNGLTGSCNFYQHKNYGGSVFQNQGMKYNSLGYIGWGDKISSAKCSGSVTVCEHAQWGGKCKQISGNIPDLHASSYNMGDKIDSIR